MTYAQLQAVVIQDSHRDDLVSLVPRFIAEGEEMIREQLVAHLLTAIIGETARIAGGLYQLPTYARVIRRIVYAGSPDCPALGRQSLSGIRQISSSASVCAYAEAGDGTIEVRGIPGDGSELALTYYGVPEPLQQDTDTNALLVQNPTLYKAAALFFLFQHTQDRELASDQLDVFEGLLTRLNERVSRQVGGVVIPPAYNTTSRSSY